MNDETLNKLKFRIEELVGGKLSADKHLIWLIDALAIVKGNVILYGSDFCLYEIANYYVNGSVELKELFTFENGFEGIDNLTNEEAEKLLRLLKD